MSLAKFACLCLSLASLLSGCTTSGLTLDTGRHIQAPANTVSSFPKPIPPISPPPSAKLSPPPETYNVTVNQLSVQDLLFSLARDARINLDVHPATTGRVTLNAVNQTLPQILDRIAKQTDIRWVLENDTLSIMPDTPYLKIYHVDYFNLARNIKIQTSIANSVATTATGKNSSTSNSSSTDILSSSQYDFWKTLDKNLRDLLRDEAGTLPGKLPEEQSSSLHTSPKNNPVQALASVLNALGHEAERYPEMEALPQKNQPLSRKENRDINDVIIHAETGVIMIRASQKKHARVAEFLATISAAAQRQVMIEATVVEVVLSDRYQAGIDWSQLAHGGNWNAAQLLSTAAFNSGGPLGLIAYDNGVFSATLQFLEQFGRTRVLSSPKVMALNNQTAVMKVVDEQVYFRLSIEEDKNDAGNITSRTYTSELHTVPVGLVMQVTPQIAESGLITLNVRPTITNISSYVEDPAVAIVSATSNLGVKSLVPNLQMREFDSTLKIPSGQMAMLGGLIQDKQANKRNGVPGLSRLPLIGDLFSYRDDSIQKIELVIFMKPVAIPDNTAHQVLSQQQSLVPDKDFFSQQTDHTLSAYRSGNLPLSTQDGPQ